MSTKGTDSDSNDSSMSQIGEAPIPQLQSQSTSSEEPSPTSSQEIANRLCEQLCSEHSTLTTLTNSYIGPGGSCVCVNN